MARIAGVDIPNDKQVAYSLTYIYGIGLPTALKICKDANLDQTKRVKDLTDEELKAIGDQIKNYLTEGDLRRKVNLDIKRLQEIGCYRGMRHKRGLPVRGQRTKTNARTRKGPKKTVANKKKASM